MSVGSLRGQDNPTATESEWTKVGWPLMQRLCSDCHNADLQEGELDLDPFQDLAKEDNRSSIKRVLEMVRFGAMPPDDAEMPTAEERKQLVAILESALFSVSCDLTPRPGKVTARRLNRAEYNYTIRDLFGMDLRPADRFPSDEVGGGFDNNGDVLSLTPTMIEKYLDAAEYVADKVVVDPASVPRLNLQVASDQLVVVGETKTGSFNGRFLAPGALVWFEAEIPYQGRYRIRVRGGNSVQNREPTPVGVFNRDGILIGNGNLMYFGGSGESVRFEFSSNLAPGKQRFFIKTLEKPSEAKVGTTKVELDASAISASVELAGMPLKPDRGFDTSKFPLMMRRVEISGPDRIPNEAFPPRQYQILKRQARKRGNRWTGVEDAARECLTPLMRQAFRAPVSRDDVEPYVGLVKQATDRDESFVRGLQIAISAVLCSPRFLFRVESPPEGWTPEAGQEQAKLTSHQVATRLSYFLWSSTPDEALLKAAESNQLEQSLEYHVKRMVSDKRGDALGSQFASQWLGLRNLEVHEADTEHFSSFDPKLLPMMQAETERLFLSMLRENRPVHELLTADYSYLNGDLAKHYGIDHQGGFQRVSLAGTSRRGILSHASILTLTSNPNRTSPVKRGKWILQNVLGTPPPDPPPGVPELEETKAASKNASLREQLEIHRASATCSSCHKVMDQLGFGLEQFDAVGRFRERAIDASGILPGGREFDGVAELSEVLSRTERDAFAKTTIAKLLTFAIGRELTPADRCTVDEIAEKTKKNGYRWMDLILGVVQSRPFLYYQVPHSG